MLTNNSYDIAVCGGGIAGISAALAAARHGKKVVLFEKEYMLGGLATAGLITIYLPLCDGFGHQVSFGIAEELLRLSVKYGAEARYPENWLDGVGSRGENDKRFMAQYNAQLFAILAERLLLSEGVDIMYGTYAVGTSVADRRIVSIYTQNKSGRTDYSVNAVIVATGDCDIAYFAGAPTETFRQGNVLAAWYYYTDSEGYKLRQLGASDTPDEEKNGKEHQHLINRRFSGLDGKEISEMICLMHDKQLNDWLSRRENDEKTVISTLPSLPQIRMTRKLIGNYTLSHTEAHTYFEDSVGMVSNWKKRGPVYEVPFGTLCCNEIKNLAVAGRCTSVNQTLWNVMRVIPCCAVTGEAAGTALALSDDLPSLDVKKLQSALRESGVALHINEIINN